MYLVCDIFLYKVISFILLNHCNWTISFFSGAFLQYISSIYFYFLFIFVIKWISQVINYKLALLNVRFLKICIFSQYLTSYLKITNIFDNMEEHIPQHSKLHLLFIDLTHALSSTTLKDLTENFQLIKHHL